MRKLMSTLLAFCMVVSMLPTAAFATETSEPAETEVQNSSEIFTEPIEENNDILATITITTPDELAKIESGKKYILGNDIDLSTYNNGIWIPISCSDIYLDGQGFKITNLNIPESIKMDYAGLFGVVTGSCQISNLNIIFSDNGVSGQINAGGIVASFNGTECSFTNCSTTGLINAQRSVGSCYAGGLIGSIRSDYTNIEKCYSNNILSAKNLGGSSYGNYSTATAGGICGSCVSISGGTVKINDTSSCGTIVSHGEDGTYAGGLIGRIVADNVRISNSHSSNNITMGGSDYNYSGGLCGQIQSSSIELSNDYSSADIQLDYNSDLSSGGLVGSIDLENIPIVNIEQCNFEGNISISALGISIIDITSCGGIVGQIDESFSENIENGNINIIDCNMLGTISSVDGCLGGIIATIDAGNLNVVMENCSFAGQLSITCFCGGRIGGFIGECLEGDVYFINSVAKGLIESSIRWDNTPTIGSFIGYMADDIFFEGRNINNLNWPIYGVLEGTITDSTLSTSGSRIRYFSEWDSETQTAYWGGISLTAPNQSVAVDGKTDMSFLNNLDQLVGNYVLVEVENTSGESSKPSTLICISPIETTLGRITDLGDATDPWIEFDNTVTYKLPYYPNTSYIGTNAIYWTLNNELEGFQQLYIKNNVRVLSWSSDTRTLTTDTGLGSSEKIYYLSPLASAATVETLENAKLENITIYYDENDLVYFASEVAEDVYYGVDSEIPDDKELLKSYEEEWLKKYNALIEAMRTALDDYAESEGLNKNDIISAQAEAMKQADSGSNSKYINFEGTNFPWKDEAYHALARFLYNHSCKEFDFGSIDISDIFAGGTLISSLMQSMSRATETYDYDDIVINIHVNQFGSAKFGSLTAYSKQAPQQTYTAVIVSTQAECAETIQAYWEELKDLEYSALINIYSAVSEDILGKTIYSFTEDFLKKEVSKYADQLMKAGVGDLAKTLNSCYNYITQVEKLLEVEPDRINTLLPTIYNIKFEDTSISDKAVEKAMEKLQDASDKLYRAFMDYAAGTLGKSDFEKWWQATFCCPVNITVYNSSGEQVGHVGEDDIWYSDDIYIEESGGAKIVDVLTDDQMSFVIEATDYGILSCSVEEYDRNMPTGRVNFYDIPLTPEQKLSFTLPKGLLSSENVIELETEGETIIADEYIPVSIHAGVNINCDLEAESQMAGNSVVGSGTYVRGDAVVLMALPVDGYRFAGWYKGDALVSTSTVYEFVAKENMSLVAKFAAEVTEEASGSLFTLTVSATGGGTVSGSGTFENGVITTVIAIPDSGYTFDGWYANGLLMSRNPEYQIEISADIDLRAKFIEEDTSSSGGGISSSGSGSTSYSITVKDSLNGSVKSDEHRASRGDTITLTISPDDGYELKSLTVLDRNNREIDVEKVSETEYSFEMPRSSVTVDAAFAPAVEEIEPLPFIDVTEETWYYDAVRYAYENDLMAGTSATTFSPNLITTRGMIVTILYSLEGTPTVSSVSDFTDVEAGQWYSNAITWAAANDIVGGYGNGLFGPADPITREQLAAILYRYAQYKGYDTTARADLTRYTDFDQLSAWALDAMAWANSEGIVNGTDDTTLSPQGNATRAQAATMLMQFCENVVS